MMSMAPAVFNLDRNKTDRIVFNALDNVVLFKGESSDHGWEEHKYSHRRILAPDEWRRVWSRTQISIREVSFSQTSEF